MYNYITIFFLLFMGLTLQMLKIEERDNLRKN